MKVVLALFCGVLRLWADGHGPAFGLSTATLGAGDASLGTAMMWRSGVYMLAPYFSYGVTGNFQVSVSSPFHLNHGNHPVGRFTGLMPGDPETEVLAAWRFHHNLTGVGTRNESTLYVGSSVSTQHEPRTDGPPFHRMPGFYLGAATGHISRRFYVWSGVGYQRFASVGGDHPNPTLLGSLVLGWRPPFLDKEFPKPDGRFFWETTGESLGPGWRYEPSLIPDTPSAPPVCDSHHCVTPPGPTGIVAVSKSQAVFSGPTFLWTWRGVALQSGILFALWRGPSGVQPVDRYRAVVGVSYFFLKGRK